MNSHELIEHSTAAELADAVASQVGDELASAVSAGNEALAFVPGGLTPKAIFPRLAQATLDWSRVTLVPGDERVLPAIDDFSNFAAVRQAFECTSATVRPLVGCCGDCDQAALRADRLLRSLRWPPDLVWLGVGADGHIASIFPGESGAKALTCETPRAVCVRPDPLPPEAPYPRVTLTLPAILSARAILIAATGKAKKELLETAFAGRAENVPLSALLRKADKKITVHWSPV